LNGGFILGGRTSSCYLLILPSPLVFVLGLAIIWGISAVFGLIIFGLAKEMKLFMLLISTYVIIVAATYPINRLVVRKLNLSIIEYMFSGVMTIIGPALLVIVIGIFYLINGYDGACGQIYLDSYDLRHSCTIGEYLRYYGKLGIGFMIPAILIHAAATLFIYSLESHWLSTSK
jgi:hypothetical protein